MNAKRISLAIIVAALCLLAAFFLLPGKPPLTPLKPSPPAVASAPGVQTTQTISSSLPNPAAASSPLPSGDMQTSAASAGPSGGEGLPDAKGEPLWGVEIAPLRRGEFHYSIIVDRKIQEKDPQNRREPDFTNRPAFEFPPVAGMGVPRQTSPNGVQFFYIGKFNRYAMFNAPIRGGLWGIDEFRPLNPAAEANWKEILANPNLGKITGVVSDANHRPIPRARVMAMQSNQGYERTVECNGAGQFTIDRLPFGQFSFKAKAWGYQISDNVNGKVEPDGKSKPIEIILQPGVAVLGQVTNDSGQPIQWAMINTQDIRENKSNAESAVSDEAGRYALACLAPGAYRATCGVKGYASITKDLHVPKDASTVKLDFILAAGGQITGKVIQPIEGVDQPAAGVSFSACTISINRTEGPQYGQMVRTKKDGTFTFEGVPFDSPTIIYPANYRGSDSEFRKQVTLEKGKVQPPLEFRLPAMGSIKGRVVNMDKQPIAGAEILIGGSQGEGYSNRDPNSEEKILTDAEGVFVFDGLALNTQYRLWAKAKGYAPTNSDTSDLVWPNSEEELIIVMQPGNTIRGQVVIAQGRQPLPGMTLTLDGGYTDRKEIETDAEGRFVWEDLPKGDYRISGKKISAEGTYLLKPHEPLFFDESRYLIEAALEATPGQSIRGKTVMQGTKAPVAKANVQCQPVEDQQRYSPNGNPYISSNNDSSFELGPLLPGKYQIHAWKTGLLPVQSGQAGPNSSNETESNRRVVIVEEGKDTPEVELLFAEGGTISGVVVDSDGSPIQNAKVWANSQGRAYWFEPAFTDESGKFAISGIPLKGDKYRAKANNSKGQQASSEEVAISPEKPSADVRIAFTDGAQVTGTVKDAAGNPIANASIGAGNQTNNSLATTGADGKYSLKNLVEGEKYYFGAEAPSFLSKTIENVEIKTGQETIVDFVLEKGTSFKGIAVDLHGEKISGANGQVLSWKDGEQSIASPFTTSFDGSFEAKNLPSSREIQIGFNLYENRNSGSCQWLFATGKLKPSNEGNEETVLVLKMGGILGGRLVDAFGKPIAVKSITTSIETVFDGPPPKPEGAACELQQFHMNGYSIPLAEGRFEIARLPLGKMNLTFTSDSTVQKQLQKIEIGSDLLTDLGDIPIESGLIAEMRLIDSKTGSPIGTGNFGMPGMPGMPGGKQTEPFYVSCMGSSMQLDFNQPDPNGRMVIKGIPLGVRELAFRSAYLPKKTLLPQPVNGRIDLGDVQMDPGETLTGTVKGPKGEIPNNCSIQFDCGSVAGGDPICRVASTRDNGSFAIFGLPVGAGKIMARCSKNNGNDWITDGPERVVENLPIIIKQGQPNTLDIVLPEAAKKPPAK